MTPLPQPLDEQRPTPVVNSTGAGAGHRGNGRRGNGGYGATINSIDVNGHHFNLRNNKSGTGQ